MSLKEDQRRNTVTGKDGESKESKERERERDRKQSQRCCDTQLLGFFLKLDESDLVSAHTHTPCSFGVHECFHSCQRSCLKAGFEFLLHPNLDTSRVRSGLVDFSLFHNKSKLFKSHFVPRAAGMHASLHKHLLGAQVESFFEGFNG